MHVKALAQFLVHTERSKIRGFVILEENQGLGRGLVFKDQSPEDKNSFTRSLWLELKLLAISFLFN